VSEVELVVTRLDDCNAASLSVDRLINRCEYNSITNDL
jgi:hypothetical protein